MLWRISNINGFPFEHHCRN